MRSPFRLATIDSSRPAFGSNGHVELVPGRHGRAVDAHDEVADAQAGRFSRTARSRPIR